VRVTPPESKVDAFLKVDVQNETEKAVARSHRLAGELRQQLNEAHAEIDRLNGVIGSMHANAAFGPWPE
jgi:hypothetical protein